MVLHRSVSGRRLCHRLFRHFLPTLLLLLIFAPPLAADAPHGEHILILHSYHPELGWTAGIQAGVRSVFERARPDLGLHVEYLDTKRNPSPEYRADYVEKVLVQKLAGRAFDLLLVSDNDAFAFALRHRNDLFAGVPIVFCGVNGFAPEMIAGLGGITGVAEAPAFAETVELALRLHPQAAGFVFIGETFTETGRRNDAILREVASRRPGFKPIFWNDFPLEDLEPRLKRLRAGEIVFLVRALNDRSGRVYSFEESIEQVRRHASVPVYGFWDFFLGRGIVGGRLISARAQGSQAAELALQVLDGENPDAIPVTTAEANRFMFDYNELTRFGIRFDLLPADSEIVNRPPSFYRFDKWQIWAGAAVILLLIASTTLLLRTIHVRRLAELEQAENARLATLGAEIGRILTRGDGLRATLQACAEALVLQTETTFGRIWTVSEADPDLLELQASAGLYTRIDGQHSRKRVGEMKVGLIASRRQAYLSNDVFNDPAFSDKEWMRRDGIAAFAGYPLVVQDRLVGVTAFFARKPLNETVLAAIASVADMIAVGIERIRAEESLQRALHEAERGREKIDAILRSLADGVLVTDLENRVVLMNSAAECLLHKSLATMVGRPVDEVLAGNPFGPHLRQLLADKRETARFDLELPAGDGARLYEARTATVRRGDGGRGGAVTVFRDVTREREVDRMKSEFIAIAAHELRTPLTAVLGYAELLLNEAPETPFSPEQRQEFLSYIFAKGEMLEQIVEDLLDLGRIETGRSFVLEKASCEMVGLVKEVVRHHQQETSRHRFEACCPAECLRVEVDRGKLQRVFDNLLSNAVKYSPDGGVIRISGGVRDGWLQITVADEGLGMTSDEAARAFDKFYRADTSDTAVRGLGLGLTISKGIIEAHGGDIWVESEPGRGTRVSFRLPYPG